jgi:hypothetical protein
MRHILFAALFIFSTVAFSQTAPADTSQSGGKTPPAASPADAAPAPVSPSDAAPIAAPVAITVDTSQGPLSVLIPQAELKGVQKDWVSYAGKGSKGKAAISEGQYTQYQAVNKNISPDPFNITATFLGLAEGVRVSVWLSDNTNFQNSKQAASDRNLALQKYVHDFAILEYRKAVQYELNVNTEKQKTLEKEMTKLMKQENASIMKVEEDNRSIVKANDAIASNKHDIENVTAQIETQKAMVQTTAADPNATKGAQKTLDKLESDKKELLRKNDKEGKNIEKYNADIRSEERVKADIKEKEASMAADIEKQKQVVQQVQAKLDGIK